MKNNDSKFLDAKQPLLITYYFVCPFVGSLEHLFTFYLFCTESQLLSQNLQENTMFRQNNKAVESVWAGPAGRGIQPQGGERNHPRPRLYHFTQVLHSYIHISIHLSIYWSILCMSTLLPLIFFSQFLPPLSLSLALPIYLSIYLVLSLSISSPSFFHLFFSVLLYILTNAPECLCWNQWI